VIFFSCSDGHLVAALSPLLANIALSVVDDYFVDQWQKKSGDQAERKKRRLKGLPNYRLIRYADDCVPRTLKGD
jgi:RNA-directed DNA polymerase